MYLIGYDIGSSSIKAALVQADTMTVVAQARYPEIEMEIQAPQPGWAEQDPELWWEYVCRVTQILLQTATIQSSQIQAVGIAYQMHGLVAVDQNQQVLRPSIIWCDSRAVEIGNQAFEAIGPSTCLSNFLNSPGNFTASKLKWVQENEPFLYEQIDQIMLPGDFIAMKLTGEVKTTISGLSEGIFWNFKEERVASKVLDHFEIDSDLIPEVVRSTSIQGYITEQAAAQTGLPKGIPITYRAGDQPNNALSLGVFEPGEVAATGGTSGVIYAIADQNIFDQKSRINGFAHVNHTPDEKRIGLLLCINGAGIQYAWMRNQIAREGMTYVEMEDLIRSIPIGSDGLQIIPFGNGAERILENKDLGAQILNLQLNQHTQAHLYRAALEGIAFSFAYGFELLKTFGLDLKGIKVGNDNLFQSEIFTQTVCNLLELPIEMYETTGAVGAAKASGMAIGVVTDWKALAEGMTLVQTTYPDRQSAAYTNAYNNWKRALEQMLKKEG